MPLDNCIATGWVTVSRLSIVKLPFVCVVAHDRRFRRWATAVNVKLILPPRQAGGSPGYASKNNILKFALIKCRQYDRGRG